MMDKIVNFKPSALLSGQNDQRVMYAHMESRVEKIKFVSKQTKQMKHKDRPFVRCFCERKLAPHQAYRCLYCGEWYCQKCAEVHFGKTRQEYFKEHEGEDPMLHENYPDT